MEIKIVDRIEDFMIDEFIQLEHIVNDRLWLRRNDLQDALEEYETDENGELNPATFMEYYTVNYRSLDAVFYVISGNKVIAGCALQNWSFDRVKLIDFVVCTEHEGRGVASLLLDKVIEYCKSKNRVEINLEVRDGMPAYNLYLKKGFEPIRLLEGDMIETDEECELEARGITVPSQDCWCMELYL